MIGEIMKRSLLFGAVLLCTAAFADLQEFAKPVKLQADGVDIGSTSDLSSSGALSPLVYDWDGDGDDDLLVGTFWRTAGVMFFENTGLDEDKKPILTKRGFLDADGAMLTIDKY